MTKKGDTFALFYYSLFGFVFPIFINIKCEYIVLADVLPRFFHFIIYNFWHITSRPYRK